MRVPRDEGVRRVGSPRFPEGATAMANQRRCADAAPGDASEVEPTVGGEIEKASTGICSVGLWSTLEVRPDHPCLVHGRAILQPSERDPPSDGEHEWCRPASAGEVRNHDAPLDHVRRSPSRRARESDDQKLDNDVVPGR